MKEIIISAYDRDYSWVNQLDTNVKVTVYRKGTNNNNPNEIYIEKNVGRDVHTFFHHFVYNYDNLSDYTFTSQDYFEDHVQNYIQIINGNINTWNQYGVQIFSECWFFSTTYPLLFCDKFGKPHHSMDLNIEAIWNRLFKNPCPETLRFTPAGHFCITKEHVRKRPVEFYSDILDILEEDESSPWIIERLMPYIFDLNYETKKNYNYQIKKDIKIIPTKFNQFKEDIFVIDCWINTKEKEDTLVKLINIVKVYGIPILLCGHYPVPQYIIKMVDYYLYDKNNDILLQKDFESHQVNSDRWTDARDYVVTNKIDFHHDYAIWTTMKNAFNLAKQLGKKYIHFLEYDNLPDETQYKQSFLEYIRHCDAVVYEYSQNSTKEESPYCSTYIYSIRTEIATKLVDQFGNKKEYFTNKPGGWQLEKVFYQSLKKLTNNIIVTKYIPNNNELNIFSAWNRNGIIKNDAILQTYLGVDYNNKLYIHFISGFTEMPADKDYLCEINYNGNNFFFLVKKGEFHLELLGDYVKDEIVKVFYQGIEIFSQTLKETLNDFKIKNSLKWKNMKSNRKINIHFIDGAFVEILDDIPNKYEVTFTNKKNGEVVFKTVIESNQWCKTNLKYYVDWEIKIKGIDNNYEETFNIDLEKKVVYISFETKSLGDTIAFIPYVEEFRKKRNCKVVCSTFHNNLFETKYPNIEFVNPGSVSNNVSALYRLGLFYTNNEIDYNKHPSNPIKEPLQKIASDILGLEFKEIKPLITTYDVKKKKQVCIAIHSTAQAKYWNNPKGWQQVVDYLKLNGYEVILLSKEEDGYMGNKNPIGIIQQPPSDLKTIIKTLQESEFFIGISSGLSWLAWASGIPVILISGFTDIYLEPFKDIERVINKNVCNGCWHTHKFDPGDWNWCPIHKNTDRQFECSKEITSEDVIKKINKFI